MKLILKISAGVIIGLLAFQIAMMKMYPPDYYEELNAELNEVTELKNRVILLQIAVHRFYTNTHELPQSLAEVSCSKIVGERFDGRDRRQITVPCAETVDKGRFFVSYNNRWAVLEPYVVNKKVRYKCSTTVKFVLDDRFTHCEIVDVNDVIDTLKAIKPTEPAAVARSEPKLQGKPDAAQVTQVKPAAASPKPSRRVPFPSDISGEWVGEFASAKRIIGDRPRFILTIG